MSNKNNLIETKATKRKRVRSPYLFPAYDFDEARRVAMTVEKDGAGSLSEEALAIALDKSAKSSGFQLKTLTASQFGLLTRHGNMLSTTPLAKSILQSEDENEKRKALVQSFLAIPLFREVAARFKGQPLPQGSALRNILEIEFKIVANRINDAERVLMDSARDTGVLRDAGDNTFLYTEYMTQTTAAGKENQNDTNHVLSPSPISSTTPASSSGTMLTINLEEHLAPFDDEEFWQIWGALGKIIRAKGTKEQKEEDKLKEE